MQLEDHIRLRHMLDAAEEALGFAKSATRADLNSNRMLAFAIVRAIEIIGEAATTVTDETKQAHPDLPWRSMAGMRNRLIHAYYDVDLDRVWDTVSVDLPPLVEGLKRALEAN